MASRVKGIQIEIDGNTTGLDKALKAVNKQISSTQKELRDVNKLLKLNPGNATLITQQQKLLKDSVQATSEKLNALNKSQSDVNAQFKSGKIDESQYRAFQREIEATNNSLKGYKSQLETSEAALGKLESSTKTLNNYFKTTKTSADSFSDILGTKLVSAIKNGTATSDQLDKAFTKIAKSSGVSSSKIDELKSELQKLDSSGSNTKIISNNIKKLGVDTSSAKNKTQGLKDSMKFGAVAGVAGSAFSKLGSTITGSVDGAISRVDTLANSTKTFSNMGFGKSGIESMMGNLQKSIEGLPTPLDDAVQGVQMFAGSTRDLDLSQQLFQSLNDGILGFGGSADQVNNAVVQLSQAFSNGKVDAESWNSLIDAGLGPALNAMADQMGITTGELKSGLSKGSISVEEFQKNLISLDQNGGGGLKSLNQIAKDNTKGIGTSIQNAGTSITKGLGDIISSFNGEGGLSGAITSLGTMIEGALKSLSKITDWIAQNGDIFGPLAAGIGSVIVAVGLWSAATAILNAVLSINPITAIIMGIVGLIAALTFFFTKTETGKKVFETLKNSVSSFIEGTKQLFSTIGEFIGGVWDGIVTVTSSVWNSITGVISGVVNGVMSVITTVWGTIGPVVSGIFSVVSEIISVIFGIIFVVISTVVNTVVSIIQTVWGPLSGIISGIFSVLGSIIGSVWNGIVAIISGVVNTVVSVITAVWGALSGIVGGIFGAVTGVISSVFGAVSGVVSGIVSTVSGAISGGFNAIVGIVSGIFNNVVNTIKSIFDGAVGIVTGIVDKIKSAFNFELKFPDISIPHISLPHFSISGSFNPIDWVNGKGIPNMGVDWYAKGGIFTKPTMFSNGGQLSGLGEAGPEAALPLNDKTLSGIGAGIAQNMPGQDEVIGLLKQLITVVTNKDANINVGLDGGIIAENTSRRQLKNNQLNSRGGSIGY